MTVRPSSFSTTGLVAALSIAVASFGLSQNSALAAGPKAGVVAGSVTSAGGVITAGSDGAEYALPSQARLVLAPGASVHVFPKSQDLQLAPGAKTATYSFALVRGHVDVIVPAKPKSAVLCSVGKLSVVVSGGQAGLLSRDETTTVLASSGDVRTLVDDRWQTLSPNTIAHFGPGHHGTPEPTIAAPALSPGQRLWFSPGEAVPIGGISLSRVPGAHHYELRLSSKNGDVQQLRRVRGDGTRLEDPFSAVLPGEYTISARSVDAEGFAGPWTPSEGLRVVGVSLPPGGYSAGGDIFVGTGQEVHFSHTDGLEMTYEGAGRYVPASQAVSLYRGETTVVSFRVPGSVYPTSARLRPRGLYAQVALSPGRAVWPRDAVQIAIELRSKDGQPVPAWLEPKAEVKLGIEPLDVAFTRDGNRLVGAVPPADKPGPWVLRVEVKDQFGAVLGRDFLEIANAPPRRAAAKTASTRVASK